MKKRNKWVIKQANKKVSKQTNEKFKLLYVFKRYNFIGDCIWTYTF